MFRLFLAFGVLFLLAGCSIAPETLGISKQQWNQYDSQEQRQIITNYKKIKAGKSKEQSVAARGVLQVDINEGKVMMPPFITSYNYEPITFYIALGACKKVRFNSIDTRNFVILNACFKNNVLLLDPSRYELNKKDGSIRFYYSPLWQKGFKYRNITSSGYARLQNVTVTIKKAKQ